MRSDMSPPSVRRWPPRTILGPERPASPGPGLELSPGRAAVIPRPARHLGDELELALLGALEIALPGPADENPHCVESAS